MALTEVRGGLFVPTPTNMSGFTNLLLDANNEKVAYILQAPKTGTIDRVCFRTGTVTTGETVDVRVETLDSSGNPSGTLFGTNTNASRTILLTEDDTWIEVTLTAGASVTRGDYLAVVVAFPAVATGNMNIVRTSHNGLFFANTYTDHFTGSWSKSGNPAVGAVRYSDGTYPFVRELWPVTALGSHTFTNTSNPDERGVKFTPTYDCKVMGAWLSTVNASHTIHLYDSSSTQLTTVTQPNNVNASSGNLIAVGFPAEVELAAGSTYRLTMKATSGTNIAPKLVTWHTSAAAAMPGSAWGFVTTYRHAGGSWTDAGVFSAATNERYQLGLVLSAVDDGAGGGGSAAPFAYGFAS